MSNSKTSSFGFELIREEYIQERDLLAQVLIHNKSGARLLSMQNDDENKVFGISFRTPPDSSNGVAHILEHCVLGGSKKYPLKEPFVELIKGSLKTFVNAMTSADKTIYPVASQNEKDFYNLVDVYLDSVLNPLITPQHLAQEGWHYELDSIDAPLRYKGVVFNEMKGAYSSPDGVFARHSHRSLFPDTTYGFDSGGDPLEIPSLTYDYFKNFHETYYHPANSYIFFYGNDDPAERLKILASYLDNFTAIQPESAIELQPKWSAPRAHSYFYSVDGPSANGNSTNGHQNGNQSNGHHTNGSSATTSASSSATDSADDENKAMLRVNWLLDEGTNAEEVMGLSVLSYVLLGTSAAPLRKRLIDSGLGEDVIGGGLGTGTRQMTFSVGMKGIAVDNLEAVEKLIWETLEAIQQEGIEQEMIDAALNTIEFSLRENNTGSYPRGLYLMLNVLNGWFYDQDPLLFVKFEGPLAAVKERLKSDPGYLHTLIQTNLLDNKHYTTTSIKPKPGLDSEAEAAEHERLAAARNMMDEKELLSIIKTTQDLRDRQKAQDPPELLAKLPRLGLEDLDREETPIPLAIQQVNGTKVLTHDLFTSGVVYLDVGFDMKVLPERLLPYMSLFGRLLTEMGTESQSYVQLLNRIGSHTGGISTSRIITPVSEAGQSPISTWFFVRAKSTASKTSEMLNIIRDILLTTQLDNVERFRQIVLRAKASAESGLIPSGHSVVAARLNSQFHPASHISEQVSGLSNLFFLRQLAEKIENDWSSVLADLEEIRATLINRSHMIANVTVDDDGYQSFEPQLAEFIDALPSFDGPLQQWDLDLTTRNEGLTMPAQVNYVGKGANLYDLGFEMHGSILPITNFLRTTWLWSNIRVQGGAYGAFCRFSRRSGTCSLVSYRDPNLTATIDVYDGAAEYLRTVDLGENDLIRSIIGAISSIDSYRLPDAKGFTSMVRHLTNDSAEERLRIRTEVLETTEADYRRFADALEAIKDHGKVVVLGSQSAIDAANESMTEKLELLKVM